MVRQDAQNSYPEPQMNGWPSQMTPNYPPAFSNGPQTGTPNKQTILTWCFFIHLFLLYLLFKTFKLFLNNTRFFVIFSFEFSSLREKEIFLIFYRPDRINFRKRRLKFIEIWIEICDFCSLNFSFWVNWTKICIITGNYFVLFMEAQLF